MEITSNVIKNCINKIVSQLKWACSLRRVCGHSFAGIVGLNPAGGTDVSPVLVVCRAGTGRSLIQGSPTECGVSLCVIKCNNNPLHLQCSRYKR